MVTSLCSGCGWRGRLGGPRKRCVWRACAQKEKAEDAVVAKGRQQARLQGARAHCVVRAALRGPASAARDCAVLALRRDTTARESQGEEME
eukprot:6202878-Pleurochrysis_carterae.AAC.3